MKFSTTIIVTCIAGISLVSATLVNPDPSAASGSSSTGSVWTSGSPALESPFWPPAVTAEGYFHLKNSFEDFLHMWESMANEWPKGIQEIEKEMDERRELEHTEDERVMKADEMAKNIAQIVEKTGELRVAVERMRIRLGRIEARLAQVDMKTRLERKDALAYLNDGKEFVRMARDMYAIDGGIDWMKTWKADVVRLDGVAQQWRKGKRGRMGYKVLTDGPLKKDEDFAEDRPLPKFELVDDAEELWRDSSSGVIVTEHEMWDRLQRVKADNRNRQRSNRRLRRQQHLKRQLIRGRIG